MKQSRHLRQMLLAGLTALLLPLAAATAQNAKPLPLKPKPTDTTTFHHLVLKDGNYQIVRKYEIVGDRVRYISVERRGGWEDLPLGLGDWGATRRGERDRAGQPEEDASPAMKEAGDID